MTGTRRGLAAAIAMKHILVVEDEEHLAIGIKFNLEAEGYDATTVADGPTALKTIEQQERPIDLVILDLMLPGMSGYAICETLRAAGNNVPILMLSARKLTEDRVRGYDLGADQYLVKPFELEELLSMVRNMLARLDRRPAVEPPTSVGDTFEFGGATVNFATFQASVDGRPVRLTNIEMSLLRYFIENEGRVIDRTELLENVWGHNTMPTTRTVDNFILRLRKYFERDPGQPRHFKSVRGAGYRFVAAGEEPAAEGT
jgi:two-component system OmpR family response regulator